MLPEMRESEWDVPQSFRNRFSNSVLLRRSLPGFASMPRQFPFSVSSMAASSLWAPSNRYFPDRPS